MGLPGSIFGMDHPQAHGLLGGGYAQQAAGMQQQQLNALYAQRMQALRGFSPPPLSFAPPPIAAPPETAETGTYTDSPTEEEKENFRKSIKANIKIMNRDGESFGEKEFEDELTAEDCDKHILDNVDNKEKKMAMITGVFDTAIEKEKGKDCDEFTQLANHSFHDLLYDFELLVEKLID